jgi:pimeloyl-ACP methyl ester carboxylesterase
MAAPALLAAAVAFTLTGATPRARAQGGPLPETFLTADGVKLHGLYHRSAKPKDGNPVVVLLYPPGPDRTMTKPGDWDGLAKRLNDEGFHVFRFDWRGHGKSTDISIPEDKKDPLGLAGFWTNIMTGPANNALIKQPTNKKEVKNSLFVGKDFTPQNMPKYFPVYIEDLAAVRVHLDQKNDQGDLNTSSIYVIGAGDAAALGFAWIASEWSRPAVHPLLGGGAQYKVVPTANIFVDPAAGADFAGAVWLSASRPGTRSMDDPMFKNLVKNTLKMRDNNPMLFLHGPEDKKAAEQGKFFFHDVLVADGNKTIGVKQLEATFLKTIENAKGLNGVNLLGNNAMLGTEDTIVKYLQARHKDRESITRKDRKFVGPYYIDMKYFGFSP